MARKFKKIASIKDTEDSGFGNYEESKGGGSPKGGIYGGKSGRVGWDERQKQGELKEGDHREDQPRTKDGKFSYNSLNGKETKYDGRGKTVNPLLTGGVNGIKIEDAEKDFASKSGKYWEMLKDKAWVKGSLRVAKEGRKFKVQVATKTAWEVAKYTFNINTGEFLKEEGSWKNKIGGQSKQEKEAKKEARKQGREVYVKSEKKPGGIKQLGEYKLKSGLNKETLSKPNIGSSTGLKHSVKELAQARKDLIALGVAGAENWSDAQIDSIFDKMYEKK